MNAVPKSAFKGPTSLFVCRRSRRAALEAWRRSADLARVVNEGWTTSVAARERCWAGGVKAGSGVGDEVPAVRRLKRRVKACASVNGNEHQL